MTTRFTVADLIRGVADHEPIIATATVSGPCDMSVWERHDADTDTAPDGWAWTPTRVLVVLKGDDGRTHVLAAPRNP